MSIGQSASPRPHAAHLAGSITIRIGDILLLIANTAPKGHRYLHENRSTSMDVAIKTIKTNHINGVLRSKAKMALAGHSECSGG